MLAVAPPHASVDLGQEQMTLERVLQQQERARLVVHAQQVRYAHTVTRRMSVIRSDTHHIARGERVLRKLRRAVGPPVLQEGVGG
mgnify:CR=1 FL=1